MEEFLVSIIIPYYKSAAALRQNLPYLLENLKLAGWGHELIIVDDGSDNELQIREILGSQPAHLISYELNTGKGEALRKGFEQASGSILIFTDPDIPYDFESVRNIVALIR